MAHAGVTAGMSLRSNGSGHNFITVPFINEEMIVSHADIVTISPEVMSGTSVFRGRGC